MGHAAEGHRDTEPLAVWGFVLTFVFWPVGLVLSWIALRRIRAGGLGGWGLAAAGTALSALAGVTTLVAVVGLVTSTGVAEAWAAEVRTRDVVRDVEAEVLRAHEDDGAWPTTLKDLDLDIQDGVVRGVEVEAYRSGDSLCVEGRTGDYVVARLDGDVAEGATCAGRGVGSTLRAVAGAEADVSDREADDAVRSEVVARGRATAEASTLAPPPDLGLLSAPAEVDLEACATLQGNLEHLGDVRVRVAVGDVFAERVADLADGALDNAAYGLTREAPVDVGEDDVDALGAYRVVVLQAQYDCWRAGYVAPPGSRQEFPATWTEPLTQAALDEDDARVERFRLGTATAEDRAAVDAEGAAELAEVEAIVSAWSW